MSSFPLSAKRSAWEKEDLGHSYFLSLLKVAGLIASLQFRR